MATASESHSHVNSAAQPIGQFAFSAVFATAVHPMTVARVLIQIGHEPMSPMASTSIFGNPIVIYPNMLKYMWHIRKTEGFLGLYRGLGARLCSGVIAAAVSNNTSLYLAEKMNIHEDDSPPANEDAISGFKRVCKETTHESISRCVGTIASHPFQVICVRSIAQFVGKETVYCSVWGSIREIYQQDGILGFFSGIVPRLVGEVITIWAVNLLVHTVNKYLIPENESIPKELKGYTNFFCSMLVSQFMYPFTVVSTCMAVNNSRLAAGNPPHMPGYDDWTQCYSELSARGDIKRGSGMFFRAYRGPVMLRHDGKPMPAPSSF